MFRISEACYIGNTHAVKCWHHMKVLEMDNSNNTLIKLSDLKYIFLYLKEFLKKWSVCKQLMGLI